MLEIDAYHSPCLLGQRLSSCICAFVVAVLVSKGNGFQAERSHIEVTLRTEHRPMRLFLGVVPCLILVLFPGLHFSFVQVHADVFRPPQRASLLATYVGVGVQILGTLSITIIFALLGFLSLANRAGLMIALLMTFALMGLPAGYTAARLYKALRGDGWKEMTTRTALMFPGGSQTFLSIMLWFVRGPVLLDLK